MSGFKIHNAVVLIKFNYVTFVFHNLTVSLLHILIIVVVPYFYSRQLVIYSFNNT